MSLRVKVECALFVVMGIVIALGYSVQRFIILPGLNPLEEKVAKKDMMRGLEAFDSHVARLQELCLRADSDAQLTDLSTATGATVEPSAALQDAFTNDKLTFAYLLDTERNVAWHKWREPGQALPRELPSGQWVTPHPLLEAQPGASSVQGLFMTEAGPALVAVHPLSHDASAGHLVVGRLIDNGLLAQIYSETSVAFQIWAANDPALPAEARRTFMEISSGGLLHVSHVTKDLFRVYATYRDVQGKHVLLLRSDINRNILAKAYSTLQEGLLAQVGLGLAALIVLVVLFRHSVMAPLTRLTRHATEIGQSSDLSTRLRMQRADEFGTLSTEFDRMVATLEEERERQREIAEALRES